MLQLPEKREQRTPASRAPKKSLTSLQRVIQLHEEVVALLIEEEDKPGTSPRFYALFDQRDALRDEAACTFPQTREEAVFQILLAGNETDLIRHGTPLAIRKNAAARQARLIAAALSFFKADKINFPEAWSYLALSEAVVTARKNDV